MVWFDWSISVSFPPFFLARPSRHRCCLRLCWSDGLFRLARLSNVKSTIGRFGPYIKNKKTVFLAKKGPSKRIPLDLPSESQPVPSSATTIGPGPTTSASDLPSKKPSCNCPKFGIESPSPPLIFYKSNERACSPKRYNSLFSLSVHSLLSYIHRMHPNSVGIDLHAPEDYVIKAKSRRVIDTYLKFIMPPGTYGHLYGKHGQAGLFFVDVAGGDGSSLNIFILPYMFFLITGVIDNDYRGTLQVVLFNHNSSPFKLLRGNCIAQLVLHPLIQPSLMPVLGFPAYQPNHPDRAGSPNPYINGILASDFPTTPIPKTSDTLWTHPWWNTAASCDICDYLFSFLIVTHLSYANWGFTTRPLNRNIPVRLSLMTKRKGRLHLNAIGMNGFLWPSPSVAIVLYL